VYKIYKKKGDESSTEHQENIQNVSEKHIAQESDIT